MGISQGVKWVEIEVVNIASGQPTLQLYGRAAEILQMKTPAGYHLNIHISLSDTKTLAQAFVIIEAIKDA